MSRKFTRICFLLLRKKKFSATTSLKATIGFILRSSLRLFFEIEGPEYTMPAHDLWPGKDTSSIFVLRRIIGEKLWQRI